MQLKLITIDTNSFAIKTRYIQLDKGTVVHYRSAATGKFSLVENLNPENMNKDITAIICCPNRSPIEISRHDGAYIIAEAKTIEVVNTPVDLDNFVFWTKEKDEASWKEVGLYYYMDYSRNDRNAKYCVLAKGVDANEPRTPKGKPIEEMVTVTWYRDLRQTSQSWRKWDDFAKTIDTRHLQTVVVREDQDPNQPGFKLI